MPASQYYLPKRELVEQRNSQLIQPPPIERSTFAGKKNRLSTFNAGTLLPLHVEEVYPGDHFVYDVTAYVRMATPLFPQFSQQNLETFAFFVPSRILWTHFPNMMGEQANPTDSIAYNVPQIPLTQASVGTGDIWDHMGLPKHNQINALGTINANALPLRAYNRIWNDWFRDENLQNSAPVATGDTDVATNYGLRNVAKFHDYFTSALPWPQKYTPPVVPLSGQAPVAGLGVLTGQTPSAGPFAVYDTDDPGGRNYAQAYRSTIAEFYMNALAGLNGSPQVFADVGSSLSTVGFDINTFRQAFMVQALLELQARGGTRYTETIRNEFGVDAEDYRLQRPEYIGGGSTPVMTTPVAQTAPTTGATVGTLGAAATAAGRHHASYAAKEHGYILILYAVRTELAYQQGLHKLWTRLTRTDFYTPLFAHLGEQAVLTQELYATGIPGNDQTIFGYQERFHELRTMYSDVVGFMNSTATTPIDTWHLAAKFTSAPVLGDTFIQDTPPMSRILAAGAAADQQQFIGDFLIQRRCTRPMPAYGTPAILGKF